MGFDWALLPLNWRRAILWGTVLGFLVGVIGLFAALALQLHNWVGVFAVPLGVLYVPACLIFYFKVLLPMKKKAEHKAELTRRMKDPAGRHLYSKKTKKFLEERHAYD